MVRFKLFVASFFGFLGITALPAFAQVAPTTTPTIADVLDIASVAETLMGFARANTLLALAAIAVGTIAVGDRKSVV